MSSRVSPWFLALLATTLVGGFLAASATSRPVLTTGIVLLVLAGWAVSLCLHEFGHAYTAYRGGDRSVRAKGYLTLDIRRYADLGLSLVLPVFFLLLGGIPLPGGAVWIDQGAIRSRIVRSLVQINTIEPKLSKLAVGLSALALIQVLAFVLNILPVPGLDGFAVLEPFLPYSARRMAARIRPWAPIALFVLILGVPGVSSALFGLGALVFSAVGGDPSLAATGYSALFFWRR